MNVATEATPAKRRIRIPGLTAFDQRLVAPGTRWRFETVRLALVLVIALRLLFRHWSQAASIPDELFDPVFAVAWLDSTPPAFLLTAVSVVGLLGALATATRRAPQVGFAIAWVSLLFLGGVWSSAGKIAHNDVLLLLAAFPFVVAGAKPVGTDDHLVSGWAPRASLIIIAAIYAIAGAQKLNHSGLEWVSSENMRWVLLQGAATSTSPLPGLGKAAASNLLLTKVVAAGSLAIELSAPVLLGFRRTRPLFVLAAASLHTGIWLTLGLDYYGWILTVCAVAIPMSLDRTPAEA